jgi:hypothetical protein
MLFEVPLEKECTVEGVWGSRPRSISREEWTNYAACGSATVSLQTRRAYVLVSAYAVSIVAIIPALIIFLSYK